MKPNGELGELGALWGDSGGVSVVCEVRVAWRDMAIVCFTRQFGRGGLMKFAEVCCLLLSVSAWVRVRCRAEDFEDPKDPLPVGANAVPTVRDQKDQHTGLLEPRCARSQHDHWRMP